MPEVMICEMSPRDGLQALGGAKDACRRVPLEQKRRLLAALVAARLPFIEALAFVSPKVIPQMADSDLLAAALPATPGTLLAGLVPNVKHYERFRATRLDVCAVFVSASEEYSRRNMNAALAEALGWAGEVAAAARADGRRLRAHVSGAFQEVYSGADSDLPTVVRVTRELLAMGCEHVALADTNGTTNPRRIRTVLDACRAEFGLERVGIHLHERGGLGIANVLAAFDAGARIFDAAVGGIGGSGTARVGDAPAPGNVATEEVVNLFDRMGVDSGVDLEALVAAGRIVAEITQLTGDPPPPSRYLRERTA